MITDFFEVPLSFDEYPNYQIDQRYIAYKVIMISDNVGELDEYEARLSGERKKIFFSEFSQASEGKMKLELIYGISHSST